MVATDKLFAGSIPEIYDRFMVPLIFEPYAADLADRVASLQPHDVLETAAGTGVLTRALASRLASSTRIVATDLNQPMLDQASRRQDEGTPRWQQADALALPFGDQGFDIVACQFGVMFFPDKAQGYKEARRMLRRGGRFLFNVWDRIEKNEFADVVTEALARVFPSDPPRFMHARRMVTMTSAGSQGPCAAGFADISSMPSMPRARPPRPPCRGCLLPGNAAAQRDRSARRVPPGRATNHATDALAALSAGCHRGRIRAFVITARADL